MNLLFLPVSLFCFILAAFMYLHLYRTWNSEEKDDWQEFNEFMYATLTAVFGISYPFMLLKLGNGYEGLFFENLVDELIFMGNVGIIGVMCGVLLWAVSGKLRTIKNPKLLEKENNYDWWCEQFLEKYPDRGKIKRRVTHILPFAVVGGCIILAYFMRGLFQEAWTSYGLMLVIIIGLDFAFTFILGDLIRLFDFSYMPPTASRMFAAGLTPEELNSFASTAVMVFGFAPFLFFSFSIFFIVLLITAVADAVASIFGILTEKYGTPHHFPKGSDKTIEGYLGGVLSSFFCTIGGALFSNLFGFSAWAWNDILLIGAFMGGVFLVLDLITSKIGIQDNYLNPLVSGLILSAVVFFLNYPVF